jgi:SHS2 domain-containing protein
MPYEFLEDITLADSAFKAWGRTVEETFAAAADAVMNAMIDDLDAIQFQQERTLHLENEALDLLLFDLLQELIYYKDADQLLLRLAQVHIATTKGLYTLHAQARGEPIDPHRHALGTDVKAVTLHRFALEQTAQGWQAFVVLDV